MHRHGDRPAYDGTYVLLSPGTLLMIEVTKRYLDDPNIDATDSRAASDHPMMSRL